MYRKNILFLLVGLVGGLIIGFVVGVILVDEEEATPVTPPAERRVVENKSFFLVSFEDINTWLASTDIEMTDDQLADMENVQGISDSETLTLYFSDTESEEYDVVNNVLSMVYNTLLTETNTEVDNNETPPFLVCLGILNDPYSPEPGLRVYVEIPVEVTDEMPDKWDENRLEGPMDENPLWSSECYDPSISESNTPEPSATE